MSKQGHGYATAEEARVIFRADDNSHGLLKDVPKDGKTVGEVVTRGNIVMKEVFQILIHLRFTCISDDSTSMTPRRRRQHLKETSFIPVIWQS